MMSFRGLTVVLLSILIFGCVQWCKAHGHTHDGDSHGHSHDEPPSFKYSKAANEPEIHHKEHDHEHHHAERKVLSDDEKYHLWSYAMGSTLLISAAPYLILYFVPVDGSAEKKPLLKILLAFASGGLLGDAFLHLIPHAVSPHDHNHDHHEHSHAAGGEHKHDMSVGLGVLAGIIAFLIVEKFVRILNGGHGHSHDKKSKKNKSNEIKVAGYLNLAADFTHNFTDGLAIGASYIAGDTIGIITTITILLHEIPHEIGDFAILLQSGCSRRKAMSLQLLTAVGALGGTTISILLQDNFDAVTTWILPFTAGGFIYIATVSVIPELLEDASTKYLQSLKEIVALLAGVGMMVIIAKYE